MRTPSLASLTMLSFLAACQAGGWSDGPAPLPSQPPPGQWAPPQGGYPPSPTPIPSPSPQGYPAAPAPSPAAPASDPLSVLLGALGSGPPPPGFSLPQGIPAGLPWPFPGAAPGGQAPAAPPVPVAPPVTPGAPGSSSIELANTINNYRVSRGLPAIPISRALTLVAETHVRDLDASPPPTGCNAHSWSRNGAWAPCCYTPDHAQAQCMWSKPGEIARFRGMGYEIAVTQYGGQLTSQAALESWKGSPAHHAVILNQDTWTNKTWRSLGAGISNGHASAWFSDTADQ